MPSSSLAPMPLFIVWFGVFLAIFPSKTKKAWAQPLPRVEGYSVYRIPVTVALTTKNPREQAVSQATHQGLNAFISHYNGVFGLNNAPLSLLNTPQNFDGLVASFRMEGEKITQRHYHAIFHLTFHKQALEKWLRVHAPSLGKAIASHTPSSYPATPEPVQGCYLYLACDGPTTWLLLHSAFHNIPKVHAFEPLELSQRHALFYIAWSGPAHSLKRGFDKEGFVLHTHPTPWRIDKKKESSW